MSFVYGARYLLGWAFAGLFIPALIVLSSELAGGVFPWPELALTVWPSSFLLLGTDCADCSPWNPFAVAVLGVSVAINVALYMAIGLAITWIRRLFTRSLRTFR